MSNNFLKCVSSIADIADYYQSWDDVDTVIQNDFTVKFCEAKPELFFEWLLNYSDDRTLYQLMDFMMAFECYPVESIENDDDAAIIKKLALMIYDVFSSYSLIGGKIDSKLSKIARIQMIMSFHSLDSALCWEAISEYEKQDELICLLTRFMVHPFNFNQMTYMQKYKIQLLRKSLLHALDEPLGGYIDDIINDKWSFYMPERKGRRAAFDSEMDQMNHDYLSSRL